MLFNFFYQDKFEKVLPSIEEDTEKKPPLNIKNVKTSVDLKSNIQPGIHMTH